MQSCNCPITHGLFEDPVIGDDGHTYERQAITDWLTKHGTSPITGQPMDINSLRTNYVVKQMVEELKSMPKSLNTHYQFELDVDIRKTKRKPLFQAFGKSIYEVEWINREGPPIILLKIDGAKANREASFYVQLSCHPHVVRTFGFVQSKPGSVMLVQECASHSDLSEQLCENEFKPTEKVLRRIFEQICDAMICLAYNDIVHGDLACRNVLVFQSDPDKPKHNLVKLTDFGLTKGSSLYSVVSTPTKTIMDIIPIRYAAPEIFQSTSRSKYSEKSDVYSMGALMWEACSLGEVPYFSLNDDDVRREKLNDKRLPQPSLCSDQLWIIINECWHLEPEDRPTFQSLKQKLLNLKSQSKSRMKPKSDENTYLSAPNTNMQENTPNNFSSSDQFRTEDNKEARSTSARNFSEEHMKSNTVNQHQRISDENQSITCSYCQEIFPSTSDLCDHLILCSNKTKKCPKCKRFIQQAIFNYHLGNNCAMIDNNHTSSGTNNDIAVSRNTDKCNASSSKDQILNNTDSSQPTRRRKTDDASKILSSNVQSSGQAISKHQVRGDRMGKSRENVESNQRPISREVEPRIHRQSSHQNLESNQLKPIKRNEPDSKNCQIM